MDNIEKKEYTLNELFQVFVKNDSTLFTDFLNNYGVNSVEKKDKRNLLMYSILQKKENYAKLLIEQGINVDYQDKLGYSALHFAVQENCLDIVLLLIRKKASIDIVDNNGNTPLWRGMYDRRKIDHRIIIELLNAGADIHKKNNYGIAPEKYIDDSTEEVKIWMESTHD
jgi:ankyrin repeat protein